MDSDPRPHTDAPLAAICDYEGSSYRTDFWTQSRTYEDKVERVALKSLLAPAGRRLVEIGAGFGRLADLYGDYEQVVLFDYSRSLLRQARARWGDTAPGGRPRYLYVAGDFYNLPFADGMFDVVTMIRVIHHAQDAPRVICGIQNIMASEGTFVLEFANKRNVKAIARWVLRRQAWNPFRLKPYEFVALNFDFHPRWMRALLRQTGFTIQAQRSVSHFRLGILKRFVPTRWLVRLDGLIQPTGRWWQLAPSVFVKSQAPSKPVPAVEQTLFRCPACHSVKLIRQDKSLICQNCHATWRIHDGLYDFKAPL
jgi:ubiquinone/menaquinone biosynthesis C-methylase UbiE